MIVLREIEEEDSLWHRKSKDAETAQGSEPQSKQEEVEKDPVIPAEGKANEEPPKDGQSKRKLNFY